MEIQSLSRNGSSRSCDSCRPRPQAGWRRRSKLAAARTVTGSIAERAYADTASGARVRPDLETGHEQEFAIDAQWPAVLADTIATFTARRAENQKDC